MRLPDRISSQANAIVKSLGYDPNSFASIGVAVNVETLLQRGYATIEVANILRPLTPALDEVVKTLNDLE